MQTFIPLPSFSDCARVLDSKRLGKQRLESFTIINVLEGRTTAWANHPAVRMWRDCASALKLYTNYIIQEWIDRGFNNNMSRYVIEDDPVYPEWWGHPLVHLSQQSRLMDKLPEHYGKLGWVSYGLEGYYWPVEPKTQKSRNINEHWISLGKSKNLELI